MSHQAKLALAALGSFSILCALFLLSPLADSPPPAHASKVTAPTAALRKLPGRTTYTRPVAAPSAQQLLQTNALATAPLAIPARWQQPTLASVLNNLPSPPPPSPTPDHDPGAAAGSYATFTANDAGVIPQGSAVRGHLSTLLRTPYHRQRQQTEDVALVPSFGVRSVGGFTIECDSHGWYLIALHLFNPNNYPVTVANTLYYLPTGVPRPPFLEDTRTVPAQSSFMVPQLAEITDDSLTLVWHPYAHKNDSPVTLVFQALTVDKL